jgi:hypothetical protein
MPQDRSERVAQIFDLLIGPFEKFIKLVILKNYGCIQSFQMLYWFEVHVKAQYNIPFFNFLMQAFPVLNMNISNLNAMHCVVSLLWSSQKPFLFQIHIKIVS